jgi:hypothetical protein
VLNQDFDYKRHLNTLANYGFKLTRVLSGSYCDPAGPFGIADNSLALAARKLLWPVSFPEEHTLPNG